MRTCKRLVATPGEREHQHNEHIIDRAQRSYLDLDYVCCGDSQLRVRRSAFGLVSRLRLAGYIHVWAYVSQASVDMQHGGVYEYDGVTC